MFCGINKILQNIFHIETKCEKYYAECCQFPQHIVLHQDNAMGMTLNLI